MPQAVCDLRIGDVTPNPEQPRKIFDVASLEELSNSIRHSGLMQPITVAPRPNLPGGARYMIVAGERRWRASKMAGLDKIPSIVRKDIDDKGLAELALVENLLRRDLGPIEEGRAYQAFLDRGYTVENLAALLGITQPRRITDKTTLLGLGPEFQDALTKGILTTMQAYQLVELSLEGQRQLWKAITSGQCETQQKLKRMAAAIRDAEAQSNLFRDEKKLTERERASLSKVDQFVERAGALIGLITEEDMTVAETVLRADATTCVAKLNLLIQVCSQVRDALHTNVAKQQAQAMRATS
jgi:ParB family chromosome partitioning protein